MPLVSLVPPPSYSHVPRNARRNTQRRHSLVLIPRWRTPLVPPIPHRASRPRRLRPSHVPCPLLHVSFAVMPLSVSRARIAELLDKARSHRIAIIGDAMLDVYLRGDVERISPEAPVPVVRVRERKLALGGAANVAQNVAALGAKAELVALIGKDVPGTLLREMLGAIGAEERALVEGARPTTTKTRVLARAQQVVRFDEEEDADVAGAEVDALIAAVNRAVDD